MWCLEVLGTADNALKTYYINTKQATKLQKISIGRHVDCDLSFPEDKSISRNHCEVFIDCNSLSKTNPIIQLTILDLGSKFGTRNKNQERLPSHKNIAIQNGDIFNVGSLHTKLRFSYQNLKICLTGLEKHEKAEMKTILNIQNAKIVDNVQDCTFLVSNKAKASMKMITAIMLQRPVVTSEYFSFLKTEKFIELIPTSSQYYPFVVYNIPSNSQHFLSQSSLSPQPIKPLDMSNDRSCLFTNYVVILFSNTSNHKEYEVLFKLGGAIVFIINVPSESSPLSLSNIKTELLYVFNKYIHELTSCELISPIQTISSNDKIQRKHLCIFYEESSLDTNISNELLQIVNEINKEQQSLQESEEQLYITWLSVSQLASAIIYGTTMTPTMSPQLNISHGQYQILQSQQQTLQNTQTFSTQLSINTSNRTDILKSVNNNNKRLYSDTVNDKSLTFPPENSSITNIDKLTTIPASTTTTNNDSIVNKAIQTNELKSDVNLSTSYVTFTDVVAKTKTNTNNNLISSNVTSSYTTESITTSRDKKNNQNNDKTLVCQSDQTVAIEITSANSAITTNIITTCIVTTTTTTTTVTTATTTSSSNTNNTTKAIKSDKNDDNTKDLKNNKNSHSNHEHNNEPYTNQHEKETTVYNNQSSSITYSFSPTIRSDNNISDDGNDGWLKPVDADMKHVIYQKKKMIFESSNNNNDNTNDLDSQLCIDGHQDTDTNKSDKYLSSKNIPRKRKLQTEKYEQDFQTDELNDDEYRISNSQVYTFLQPITVESVKLRLSPTYELKSNKYDNLSNYGIMSQNSCISTIQSTVNDNQCKSTKNTNIENSKILQDVRKFVKNYIACSATLHDRIRMCNMNSVLPKESEREIQLRVEEQEKNKKIEFFEQLFTDDDKKHSNIGITGYKRK